MSIPLPCREPLGHPLWLHREVVFQHQQLHKIRSPLYEQVRWFHCPCHCSVPVDWFPAVLSLCPLLRNLFPEFLCRQPVMQFPCPVILFPCLWGQHLCFPFLGWCLEKRYLHPAILCQFFDLQRPYPAVPWRCLVVLWLCPVMMWLHPVLEAEFHLWRQEEQYRCRLCLYCHQIPEGHLYLC